METTSEKIGKIIDLMWQGLDYTGEAPFIIIDDVDELEDAIVKALTQQDNFDNGVLDGAILGDDVLTSSPDEDIPKAIALIEQAILLLKSHAEYIETFRDSDEWRKYQESEVERKQEKRMERLKNMQSMIQAVIHRRD